MNHDGQLSMQAPQGGWLPSRVRRAAWFFGLYLASMLAIFLVGAVFRSAMRLALSG